MAATTKTEALRLATLQSQRAQRVTRALRSHGWRTHYNGGERRHSDDAYRARVAREALEQAELVARDAEAILSHIRSWAIDQGALTASKGQA